MTRHTTSCASTSAGLFPPTWRTRRRSASRPRSPGSRSPTTPPAGTGALGDPAGRAPTPAPPGIPNSTLRRGPRRVSGSTPRQPRARVILNGQARTTPSDRYGMRTFVVLDPPVPAPHQNAESAKNITAGHSAGRQQRRNPGSGACVASRTGQHRAGSLVGLRGGDA